MHRPLTARPDARFSRYCCITGCSVAAVAIAGRAIGVSAGVHTTVDNGVAYPLTGSVPGITIGRGTVMEGGIADGGAVLVP